MIPKLLWVAFLFNLTSLASLYAAPSGPLPFTGVNLAGGEFWMPGKPKEGVRPNYGVNYSYPTEAEIDYFSSKGMNIFRYQFLWETLQPALRTPFDKTDLERLKTSVKFATSRKLVVLLDPHNYARYYGTNVVGGPKVGTGDFAEFWERLALEFKNDPYVWFGLVNEPHDMPTEQWFEAANACIVAIRQTGARNLILVPGNSWSGAHSWTSGGERSNAKHVLGVKDPLDYWAIEVHQYLDADSSGTHRAVVSPTIGSERLAKFVAWCREHKKRAVLGEFGAPVVPNGQEALDDLLSSMERDRDVWLGWTWWAAGSRWGNYMFTIQPRDGADRPQMVWLQPHLHGATMPRFNVRVQNGTGGGDAPACTVQAVEAGLAPAGTVFRKWTGDVAWLADAGEAKTTVTVPFRDIQVEAVFEKAR
jgi:endoglucanase